MMIDGATLQPGVPLGVHPSGLSYEQCYELQQRLSSGSFGTVYTTQLLDKTQPDASTIFACKVIDRTKLKPESDATVLRELAILKDIRDLDHVTQMKDCFVTPTTVYVVQTYCRGGDVFEQLSKRSIYTERDARDLAQTLLKVMELLHLRRLCHRDLKPENILLKNRMQVSQIVVADFGMAKYVPEQENFLKTRCGTPAFVAPEVIAGREYGVAVDMWSIGTLFYMLLAGHPPFADPTFQGLFRKIQGADYDFSHPAFQSVSVQAKQCLASLLRVDPYYRASATQALQSTWFTDGTPDDKLSSNDLKGSIRELKTWVAKRRFKSAVHAVRLSSHFSRFVATDQASLLQKVKAWDNAQASGNGTDLDPKGSKMGELLSQWRGKTQNFEDLYEIQEEIAKGVQSTVYRCVKKPTSGRMLGVLPADETLEPLAVKKIPRASDVESAVLHEVAVMQNLRHPSLVQIKDFLEDDDFYYVVLECVPGKTVLEHLMKMKQSFTENNARAIVAQLLEAIAYVHGEGVVHRDVTLENLLLVDAKKRKSNKDDAVKVKLCDFGLARRVPAPRSVTRCCGTPLYMAPEVLKHIPYDQAADMWSVGVLLYMLLVGAPPFAAPSEKELFSKIRRGEWCFPDAKTTTISDAAKELVSKLLVVEPMQRLTAQEALRTSWFQADANSLSSIDLSKSVSKLKDFRSKFKSVAKVVMKLTPSNTGHHSRRNSVDEGAGVVVITADTTPGEEEVETTAMFPKRGSNRTSILNSLFSQDPEQKEEHPDGGKLDNKALGLPASQTASVKHLV